MAEDLTATLALNLDGTGAARGARTTADALAALRAQMSGSTDELRGMQAALRNLKGSAGTSKEGIDSLKQKIAGQKAVIATAQQAYIKMGGSFKALKAPTKEAASGISQLVAKAKESGGPIGRLASALGGIGTITRGAVIAAGIVGIAAALVALGAAAVKAAADLAIYGLRQADARRSELLQLEGLTKIRSYLFGLGGGYARAADSAGFLQATIDKVSSGVALGRERIAQYASQLYKMGLRAGNLQEALEGVAITAATQGEEQGSIFASWAAGAAMTGQSVKRLSDDVRARLGGIAKAQLLSLDVQSKKLRENIGHLFDGLRIDKILGGVASLTELFSQSTASGRALKSIVDAVGNTLGGMFDGPALLAKRFFQGMIIGGLHLTIGFLKVRNAIKGAFGDSSLLRGMTAQKTAVAAGVIAVSGLAVALGLAAAAATALAGAVGLIVTITGGLLGAVGLVAYGLVKAGAAIFGFVRGIVTRASDIVGKDGWLGLGKALVLGLVNGIKSGIGWVIEAMKDMALKGIGAFKAAFQIHSPSGLMKQHGKDIVRGDVEGVKQETPKAEGVMGRLAEKQVGAFTGAGAASGGSRGSTRSQAAPLIGSLTLTINAASGAAEDIKEAVLQVLHEALDNARIQQAQPVGAI